jgi:hypothetical protein
MFCAICGVELPEEANFCWKCGRPQRDDIAAPKKAREVKYEYCHITFLERKTIPGNRLQLIARGRSVDGKEYVAASSDFLITPYNQGPRRQAIRQLIDKLEADGWEQTEIIRDPNDWDDYRFRRPVEIG